MYQIKAIVKDYTKYTGFSEEDIADPINDGVFQ